MAWRNSGWANSTGGPGSPGAHCTNPVPRSASKGSTGTVTAATVATVGSGLRWLITAIAAARSRAGSGSSDSDLLHVEVGQCHLAAPVRVHADTGPGLIGPRSAGDQEQHPVLVQPLHRGQEPLRRPGIGPVEILDHHCDGAAILGMRPRLEDVHARGERPFGVRRPQLPSQFIRDVRRQLVGLRPDHHEPVGEVPHRLPDEGCLPGPRLTLDPHDPRTPVDGPRARAVVRGLSQKDVLTREAP